MLCTDVEESVVSLVLDIQPGPTGDQELGAETSQFSTQAPEPAAPENFNLDLNDKKTGVRLSFAPVTCARLYRVYNTREGEEELLRETSDTSVDIDSIEPCSDLR